MMKSGNWKRHSRPRDQNTQKHRGAEQQKGGDLTWLYWKINVQKQADRKVQRFSFVF